MEEDSFGTVVQRATVVGFTMGLLLGALVPVVLRLALGLGPWPIWSEFVLSDLVLILCCAFGGFLGALAGVVLSLPVGLVLAAERDYLRHHPRWARIHAGALAGLLLTSIILVAAGSPATVLPRDGGWMALLFALGLALGGLNVRFVITGEECRAARWLARSGS